MRSTLAVNSLAGAIDENGPESSAGKEATGEVDLDERGTATQPSSAQRNAVLRAPRSAGTATARPPPSAVTPDISAVPAMTEPSRSRAAGWSRTRGLFGLTAAGVAQLSLVSDEALTQSKARVVLLRQEFGGLISAFDGMVTVGIAPDGQVPYVSSSIAPNLTAQRDAVRPGWGRAALVSFVRGRERT